MSATETSEAPFPRPKPPHPGAIEASPSDLGALDPSALARAK